MVRSDLARTGAVGLGKVQNRRLGKEWLVAQRSVGAGKEGLYRQHKE